MISKSLSFIFQNNLSSNLVEISLSLTGNDPAFLFKVVLLILLDDTYPFQFLQTEPDNLLTSTGVFISHNSTSFVASHHMSQLSHSLMASQINSSGNSCTSDVQPVII